MSTIDQQFIEYIVKSVVGHPDEVSIERTVDERGVLLELSVNPEDLGRVIGKRGSGAQALRTLLRALGTKNEARYNLKIVDTGEAPQRSEQTDNRADDNNQDNQKAEQPSEAVEEPQEAPVAEEAIEQSAEVVEEAPAESSRAEQTRRELADLDDLDI